MTTPERAAEILLERRAAHESLASWIGFRGAPHKPAKHHKLLIEQLQRIESGEIDRLMVCMPPGSAKALALDTPIPTPSGWATMESLCIGDEVFDERGVRCRVTWKSPIWRDRPVYAVTTDCGDRIVADRDHEWLVRCCGKREVYKIKETHALHKKRSKRVMIKRAAPLETQDVELGIDPYLLGLWLGDGTSASLSITAAKEDARFYRKELAEVGIETSDRAARFLFGVLGQRKNFTDYGLVNDPHHATVGHKHIPSAYLRAGRSQRLALLQGLIDSDGTVCDKRGCSTFTNTNRNLAEGVLELVHTLGVKAALTRGTARLGDKDCGFVYRVAFYMEGSARLPRKAVRTRNQFRTPNTYIDVEPAGTADTVCIEVDSPSHLFLCGRSMTPTHNSTYVSVEFPPWYLGRHPESAVIAASHTQELAERFSRRVRNIVSDEAFQAVFKTTVAADSAAAGRWDTDKGGEYFAAGVGGSITGRRADLVLIDDPVKSREDADSDRARDKTWEWYVNDLLTRLKPNARCVVVMCMTGDTRVMMADGTERELKSIRSGDEVATYDAGRLSITHVIGWKSQGEDVIYEIRTRSRGALKANSRHPFLVSSTEGISWKRLKDLKRGDFLVKVSDGAIGKANSVLNATCQPDVKGFANLTTTRPDGQQESGLLRAIENHDAKRASRTDTAFPKESTSGCSQSRMAGVPFVGENRILAVRDTGRTSCASITATEATRSEDCSATTAICLSDVEQPLTSSRPLQDISDFTLDEILGISLVGFEEVFDVQIDRTENFIANGYVSHNTRWHEDDLGGRILEREKDRWHVVSLPMEAMEDDALGRKPGERLWGEWFTDEMVELAKQDTRSWWALYQQSPTSDEGGYFKREWLNEYEEVPKGLRIYGSSDFAVTEGSGDFTEHGVAGVDPSGNLYILDWWRGQKQADFWIDRMADLIETHQPSCWFGESGVIRRSVEPFMVKRLTDRGAFQRIEWLPSVADKEARARGIQAMMSMGKVFWPKNARWKTDVQGQILRFPAGKHDDAVDVLSLFGRGLKFVNASKKPVRRFVPQPTGDWMRG